MKITLWESETIVGETPPSRSTGADVTFQKSVTIHQPIGKVYAFWRNLENLPSFMKHLESVTVIDEGNSYWALRSSKNNLWAWGVEITAERENEIIAWRSCDDADIQTAGSVRFSKSWDNQSTVVNLMVKCSPPADEFRASVVQVFARDMQTSLGGDLARLKTLLEGPNAPVFLGELRHPSRIQTFQPVMLAGQLGR